MENEGQAESSVGNGGAAVFPNRNQTAAFHYAGLEEALKFLHSKPTAHQTSPNAPKNDSDALRVQNVGVAASIVPGSNGDRVKAFSQLNRSDLNELERHWGLLGGNQQRRIRAVMRKPELYSKRFGQPEYLPQSAILLLSEGWPSAERYACCGIRNRGNPSGHCRLHKYCPACCWREKQTRQLMYVPAFDNGTWFWMTGSFNGDLAVNSATVATDSEQWTRYWDCYKAALENWVAARRVRGVFWTEELHVGSLLPMRALPHVHCILEADDIGEEEVQELKASLHRLLLAALGPDYLEPNLKLSPIHTSRGLLDRIGYMVKPLNILRAYEREWAEACSRNRRLAQKLNNNVTEMVMAYANVTNDRRKLNAKGNLDSKTKSYIGIPRKQLGDYRGELTQIRAERHENYIEQQEVTE